MLYQILEEELYSVLQSPVLVWNSGQVQDTDLSYSGRACAVVEQLHTTLKRHLQQSSASNAARNTLCASRELIAVAFHGASVA